MNNVELVNSYLVQCCIVKSRGMVKSVEEIKKLDEQRRELLVSQIETLSNKMKKLTNSKKDNYKKEKLQNRISRKQSQITDIDNKKYHIVWGSKKLMRDYVSQQMKLNNGDDCKTQHIITKEELEEARLDGIYVVGEALKHGNRFCRLTEDLKHVEICFDRKMPRKKRFNIVLDLIYDSNDYKEILKDLYYMQQQKLLAITYNIQGDKVGISYDEGLFSKIKNNFNINRIHNRYMSIDLNPNYLGWSIVDWYSSSHYKIRDAGFYSLKELNDEWFSFNRRFDGEKLPSDAPERIQNHNKRLHEIYEITKNLMHKANYYKVGMFAYEKLSFVTSDKGFGQNFNTLCNNLWEFSKMKKNLDKWCSYYQIRKVEIECKFSSIYGNIIFRKEHLPDPVNAALEIGRRAYEYDSQYIRETKEIKHNIVKPVWDDFKESIAEAQEAFSSHILSTKGCVLTSSEVSDMIDVSDLYELYRVIKRMNVPYRIPVKSFTDKTDGLRLSSRR